MLVPSGFFKCSKYVVDSPKSISLIKASFFLDSKRKFSGLRSLKKIKINNSPMANIVFMSIKNGLEDLFEND